MGQILRKMGLNQEREHRAGYHTREQREREGGREVTVTVETFCDSTLKDQDNMNLI